MRWPRSHADQARRAFEGGAGSPLRRGDTLQDYSSIFVRCYDCEGEGDGCESCGGTGFDWSDTLDVRATIKAVVE